jgi:hypothetical protein
MISRIDSLANRLELALSAEDWEAIKLLDEDVRQGFASWVKVPDDLNSAEAVRLREATLRLMTLYRQVVSACNAHRDSLGCQLQGLRKGRKGVQAYHAS